MEIERLQALTETATKTEPLTADAISKYKISADIANRAMVELVRLCGPQTDVAQLCALGDQFIHEQLAQVFNRGQVEKGPSQPTSITVNHGTGHFSPLQEETEFLQAGDVVKITLGVQLDGFIATLGHTHIIPAGDPMEPTRGRAADAVCAAHLAAEAVCKLLRPGTTSAMLTSAVEQVSAAYHCTPVIGSYSANMKRFILDGEKQFLNGKSDDVNPPEFIVGVHDVFNIDVCISTGAGKTKELDARTTVYQRDVTRQYNLKMKSARAVYAEITEKTPTMLFSVRSFDAHQLLGLKECVSHGLLVPYPPLFEKKGEVIAQFRFTALVHEKGTERLTAHALPYVHSAYSIEDESLKGLLGL